MTNTFWMDETRTVTPESRGQLSVNSTVRGLSGQSSVRSATCQERAPERNSTAKCIFSRIYLLDCGFAESAECPERSASPLRPVRRCAAILNACVRERGRFLRKKLLSWARQAQQQLRASLLQAIAHRG